MPLRIADKLAIERLPKDRLIENESLRSIHHLILFQGIY
jgi:hypothetical protein